MYMSKEREFRWERCILGLSGNVKGSEGMVATGAGGCKVHLTWKREDGRWVQGKGGVREFMHGRPIFTPMLLCTNISISTILIEYDKFGYIFEYYFLTLDWFNLFFLFKSRRKKENSLW